MENVQSVDNYILLQEQEKHVLGSLWRGATLKNAQIDAYAMLDFVVPELAGDPNFTAAFMNQHLVTAQLDHPNILRKYKTLQEKGRLVSVMEFQEGFTLRKVLARCAGDGFPFSIDHALLVASKLLAALDYAKTKQLTHGLVSPDMLFVTNEGEIKLRGFSFSGASKYIQKSHQQLLKGFADYTPDHVSAEANELKDIFACGAILFEMLTGHVFKSVRGNSPENCIDQAAIAADESPIPDAIKAILKKSLVAGMAGAYSGIREMNSDMENLLYSGDYSPTTFNLAFFMHSAFRSEMEGLAQALEAEKTKSFAAEPSAPAPPSPSPQPEAPEVQQPEIRTQTSIEAPKSSKAPMILGAVAALAVVIAVVVFVVLPKIQTPSLEEQQAQETELLRQEADAQSERELAEQQEFIQKQNELLMSRLEEQKRKEREAKKEALREELRIAEDEINRLKRQTEQAKREQELRDQIAKLEAEKQRLEKEEVTRKKQLDETRKKNEAALKKPGAATADNGDTKLNQPLEQQTEETVADSGQTPADSEPAEDNSNAVVSTNPEPAGATEAVKTTDLTERAEPIEDSLRPPRMGEIVDLDGTLEMPVLVKAHKRLTVPSKAIRKGHVRKDSTISFIMKILVNPEGKVEDAELFRNPLPPSAPDYGMTERAMKAAQDLEFTPPKKMGVRVRVWIYVPINFQAE